VEDAKVRIVGVAVAAVVLCEALAAATPTVAQPVRDYWFIGGGGLSDETLVEYVDVASITPLNGDVKRAWTWRFYSKSAPQFAGWHAVDFLEVNCRTHQRHSLQLAMNDGLGQYEAAWSEDKPETWSYVVPGTLGEHELWFICSSTTARPSLGTRLGPGVSPEQHAQETLTRQESGRF
jgi:hypothetical protein